MQNTRVRAQVLVPFHTSENWAQRGQVACPNTEKHTRVRSEPSLPASVLLATTTLGVTNIKRQWEQRHQCIVGAQ